MRKKLVILSIIFAVAAGVATYFFFDGLEAKTDSKAETTKTLVVVKEISSLQRITPADVTVREITNNQLLPGAVKQLTGLKDAVAKVPIYPGEQIVAQKLLFPDQAVAGLSFKITPGKRAVSIAIDDVQGLSGLIKPGDRVDVYATIEPQQNMQQSNGGGIKAVLVVENVRLLAVNQLLNRGEDVVKMANVSIEVESKQSQAVILASQLGRMHLVLRHPEDNQMLKFKPLGSNTFFGGGGPSNGANNGSNS